MSDELARFHERGPGYFLFKQQNDMRMENLRNIMITTKFRGVFVAQIEEDADLTPRTLTGLKNARMVIKWRNGEGLQGMANYGPTNHCRLSAVCDIAVIHGVTAVFAITDEAAKKIW